MPRLPQTSRAANGAANAITPGQTVKMHCRLPRLPLFPKKTLKEKKRDIESSREIYGNSGKSGKRNKRFGI